MSKSEGFMCQCTMERENPDGSVTRRVAWIPERLAKVGQAVKFKEGEAFDEGYVVKSVYGENPL